MGPEVWVTIGAVFVAGGAIGSAGTLLAQFLLKRIDLGPPTRSQVDAEERRALAREVGELHKHLRNMDARLDFTEQLLDGGLPLASPPTRLPAPELNLPGHDDEDD